VTVDSGADRFSKHAVERRTREWIAQRCRTEILQLKGRIEQAQPTECFGIFDDNGEPQRLTPRFFKDLLRRLRILRCLDGAAFSSVLDVGAGMDHLAHLVSFRCGAAAYYADFVHLVNLPAGRLHGKLDHAFTVDLGRLPFPDGTFDVVVCSEVLEHLVRPVEALVELLRVTRRLLVMTSLEALVPTRWARWWSHHRVDVRIPHVERNFLVEEEIAALFGPGLRHEPLWVESLLPVNSFAPSDAQTAAYAGVRTRERLIEALAHAAGAAQGKPCMGIVLARGRPGNGLRPTPANDHALAAWLVERAVEVERAELALLRAAGDDPVPLVEPDRRVSSALLERARCPDCAGELEPAGSGARCRRCGIAFDGSYGVPILYPRFAAEPTEEETLRCVCGDDSARRRLTRRLMRRLRRNERRPGAIRRAAWRLASLPAR
jgi:SAM-dependent methyltransferase